MAPQLPTSLPAPTASRGTTMLKRRTAAIIALLSLAVAAPLASAAPTKHQLNLKIQDSTITSQGDRPGNKQTTAGLVSGNPFGQGVESISDKVTKATQTTFTFQGKITIYTSSRHRHRDNRVQGHTSIQRQRQRHRRRQVHRRHRSVQGSARHVQLHRS